MDPYHWDDPNDDADDINWASMYLVVGYVFTLMAAKKALGLPARLVRRMRQSWRSHVQH